MDIFIYGLFDPFTLKLMYIGKTTDLYKRNNEHLNRKGKTKKDKWIEELIVKGAKPLGRIIECCDETNWLIKERYYIKKYYHKRNKLLNERTVNFWDKEIDLLIRNGNFYKVETESEIYSVVQFENGEVWKVFKNTSLKKPRFYIGSFRYIIPTDTLIYTTKIEDLPILPKRFKYPFLTFDSCTGPVF